MVVALILTSILVIGQFYVVWNLMRKVERLEDDMNESDEMMVSIFTKLESAYARMKDVDRLGSFEADDESGFIFDKIKTILSELNDEYDLDGETQTEEK